MRDSVLSQLAVVLTDIDGRRSLIRDRSRLTVETIQERVKGEAELVLGFGPAKTLQRGFVMTKKKGEPLTRKAQVGHGEHIELQFADGNIGATTD
jgi:exonuclease VII large subunit